MPITQNSYVSAKDMNDLLDSLKVYFKKKEYSFQLASGSKDITIPDFKQDADILLLYNRGIYLHEGTDYTKTATGATLVNSFDTSTTIEAVLLRIVSISTLDYDDLKGDRGDTGVSISSVVQTTTSTVSSGENVITVTLSNGAQSTFKIYNGAHGSGDDVYSKAEIDALIAGLESKFVLKAGDTMTGRLNAPSFNTISDKSHTGDSGN